MCMGLVCLMYPSMDILRVQPSETNEKEGKGREEKDRVGCFVALPNRAQRRCENGGEEFARVVAL